MKTKLFCLFLLLSTIHFGRAQDSTVILNTSMFDKYLQTISLTKLNGWVFKQGNDISWAKSEIATTGWTKLNPSQLTAKNADKNGTLEGWLRLRFKLDSSFENMRIGIEASRWAATDIYIDGNYITSYGSTGLNGKPYEENRNVLTNIQQLQIKTGKEHILAVHIVDHVAPLNHRFLKTESLYNNFGSLITLTGPFAQKAAINYIRDNKGYALMFSGIIGFLSVLFWFLYWQNRGEKNLLAISISTSFFFTWIFLVSISLYSDDLDFGSWWLIFFIAFQCFPLAVSSMIYTIGQIFRFKYKKVLVIFGILWVSLSVTLLYFKIGVTGPDLLIAIILIFYITLSSWKRLRGAQWAVVAGVISTVIFSFTWAFLQNYYQSPFFPHAYFYESGMCLSFPASLMVYVAMRFKEILTEVQVNAKQVVQLSEEKKEQAVKQQKILEEEVVRQTIELRSSLENLKSTQAQLIQAEKMASLGELTAGIAHEIQNPLNFVNNFSEVNKEMLEELKAERLKPKPERNEPLEDELINDVIENEAKINHHGKRADAIVKGMLQHSRSSTGVKELTDINALCDEYLRLSYHGLRAKDKEVNAIIKTDFDDNVGKINIIPQDIGRVLLNLYNNAFYAVSERKRNTVNEEKDGNFISYEPTVSVTTKKSENSVNITVGDNGNGIPQKVIDKIFQPFFTTKPTGEGTGLGLSLSYDIVKAQGGEIKVESKEGEGTAFVVELPFKEIFK